MKLGWKIWLLIALLIMSLLLIFVSFSPLKILALEKGVVIKSVERNSTEFNNGLRTEMIITEINSRIINNPQDYSNAIADIFSQNKTQRMIIKTSSGEFIFPVNDVLSITVAEIPKTNLKTGLDLSGGARALVKPVNITLTDSELSDLIQMMSERFNVYGLKDITITSVRDLQGENYLLIEIAGATPTDLEDLASQQGNFEARIGNRTVFSGGKGDIAHVERSGQLAGIEGCSATQSGQACRFRFQISLTEEAAQNHALITGNLSISSENAEYLSEKLDLYLDGSLVDSLYISKELKGRVTTQVIVSGSGTGATQQEAIKDAQRNMNKLQTLLITGSLPYKLEIVKLDTISPVLGKEFASNLLKLALIVFVIISVVLFIKYRKIKITSAVILTMFSEAILTLGFAALIKWNLDAPSIAGLIAGMGTGVNDQIVIIDESLSNVTISLKDRIKRAFFIILGAFFTIIAAMLPLFWAGAGMLKGFALTTIVSVLAGILITRPAFAEILRRIQGE